VEPGLAAKLIDPRAAIDQDEDEASAKTTVAKAPSELFWAFVQELRSAMLCVES
jgi:hypothetical protein